MNCGGQGGKREEHPWEGNLPTRSILSQWEKQDKNTSLMSDSSTGHDYLSDRGSNSLFQRLYRRWWLLLIPSLSFGASALVGCGEPLEVEEYSEGNAVVEVMGVWPWGARVRTGAVNQLKRHPGDWTCETWWSFWYMEWGRGTCQESPVIGQSSCARCH